MTTNGEWSSKKVQWNDVTKKIIYKKYLLIDKCRDRFIVKNLCLILEITCASYYRWIAKER